MQAVKTKYLDSKLNEFKNPDPRLLKLFDEPNAIMDGATLFALMEGYRLCSGGYVLLKRANGLPVAHGKQFPDELLVYPLTKFQPRYRSMIRDPYALEGYDFIGENGSLKRFNIDQLVIYQDPDFAGMFAAVPALAQVISASRMYAAVDAYMNAILQNNARPGMVITKEDPLQKGDDIHEDERSLLAAQIRQMHGGPNNAGKPLVLTGKWKIDTLPLVAPKDVVSHDLWIQVVQRVAMVFKVPPMELGVNDNVNRASASVMKAAFVTGTLIPMLELHSRILNRGLFRPLGLDYSLQFDPMSLPEYTDVIATRIDNVSAMIATGTPRNEAYQRMNIPVDDQPFGKVALLKVGYERAEDLASEKVEPVAVTPIVEAQATKPPEPVAAPKAPKPEGKSLAMRVKAMGIKKRRAIASECWGKCVEPFEATMNAQTAKWTGRWKGHFIKRLNHFLATGKPLDEDSPLAKNASHVFEPFAVTDGPLGKSFVWKGANDPFIPSSSDIEEMFPDDGDSVGNLKNLWRASFADVEGATISYMKDELGSIDLFAAQPPEAHRAIALDRLGDAVQVDDTIRSQLKSVMQRELSQSPMPGPVNLAASLRAEANHVFDKAHTRANTIARTELGAVLGDYRNAIKLAEKHATHSWSSAGDGCVRLTHQLCESEGDIPIQQAFSNGLKRPHDPEGDASEVCNCRCVEL